MKTRFLWVLIVGLCLGACAAPSAAQPTITFTPAPGETLVPTNTPAPTETPAPTSTPRPTNTALPTNTPKPTETATLTPTRTPLPTELAGQILQNYRVMVFIQANATLLNETAVKVRDGKLDTWQTLGSVLALTGLTGAINEAITQTAVLDFLMLDWDRAVVIHETTRDILARWLNKKIKSDQVVAEVEPILKEIDSVLLDVESRLANEYDFDADYLTQQRQDAVDKMRKVFEPTATPAASPTRAPKPALKPVQPAAATLVPTEPPVAVEPTIAPSPAPTLEPTQPPIPTQEPTLPPVPTQEPTQPPAAANCDPSYPTVCIPPFPPDLNCLAIPYKNFVVLPPDPHRFDADKDGIGCEK